MGSTTLKLDLAILIAAVLALGVGLTVARPATPVGAYENKELGFQIDIPPGFRAVTDKNGVLVESAPCWWSFLSGHDPVTVMAVRVRPAGKGGGYPVGAVVKTKGGLDYVIYPWKESKWPLFSSVAESFEFVKR